MPSPGEDIQSWSTVAANNGTADPLIVWSEGQPRASVNNSARSEMAAHAKNRNLINGSIVTTGSANAQQFLSGLTYTTIPTNLVVRLKIGSGLTNTASTTLNMDGIGDVLIKTTDGANLLGGELVGDDYVDLLYNGTNWIFLYAREFFQELITGGGGIIVGMQKFETPGTFTYTPTPGMECCIIECFGAGGGGAGAVGAPGRHHQGGGGGSGGYSRKLASATDIGASQTGTVGTGGTYGLGPGAGGPGGATSLGSLCGANGGGGGLSSWESGSPAGGDGATAGTGDIAIPGTPGGSGFWGYASGSNFSWALPGDGGAGPLGGGARTPLYASGTPGTGYGAGGSGGNVNNAAAGANGGAGASGAVIITEFSGRGAAGRDGDPGPVGPIGPPGPAGAGTGDVLVHGTPTAGQLAQWFDTSHIQGVDLATVGFTTGDAKITLKTTADVGWVLMNDGTIGSTTSGASTRANADTQALFTLLFNNITDAWAPILTSAGAATTRAVQGSAAAAWAANCRMTLPRQLGRSLCIAGTGSSLTARALGEFVGAETHTQTIGEMPAHTHVQKMDDSGSGFAPFNPTITGYGNNLLDRGSTGSQGGGTPMDTMNPSAFWSIMIKL